MEPIKTIGTILGGRETRRDAIHVAILPVIADEDYIGPGESIGILYGTGNLVRRRQHGTHMGVADPFLASGVRKGEQFWMFLLPGTVTSLRHEWVHPLIDQAMSANESEQWLHKFADKWNFDYAEMISNAGDKDGYIVARGTDLHGASELGEDRVLFWHHLETLTGRKYNSAHREKFTWSCSC